MYRLVTPASGQILDLATIKAHCRVDSDDATYDALLVVYQTAVEVMTRQEIDLPLLTEIWTATFACPDGVGRLTVEGGPNFEASKVEILISGVYVEQDAATWVQRGIDRIATLVKPKPTEAGGDGRWPAADRDEEAFRVTYAAGYGGGTDVPAPVQQAMLLMIGDLFANRAAKVPANLVANPTYQALISPYRRRAA